MRLMLAECVKYGKSNKIKLDVLMDMCYHIQNKKGVCGYDRTYP